MVESANKPRCKIGSLWFVEKRRDAEGRAERSVITRQTAAGHHATNPRGRDSQRERSVITRQTAAGHHATIPGGIFLRERSVTTRQTAAGHHATIPRGEDGMVSLPGRPVHRWAEWTKFSKRASHPLTPQSAFKIASAPPPRTFFRDCREVDPRPPPDRRVWRASRAIARYSSPGPRQGQGRRSWGDHSRARTGLALSLTERGRG